MLAGYVRFNFTCSGDDVQLGLMIPRLTSEALGTFCLRHVFLNPSYRV